MDDAYLQKTGFACFDTINEFEGGRGSHSQSVSQSVSHCTMSLNVPGLVVMVLFYLLVLGTGIWASVKSRRLLNSSQADRTEITLLGNRGISLMVGVFTMTGKCVEGKGRLNHIIIKVSRISSFGVTCGWTEFFN